MQRIEFFVPGVPKPGGSKKGFTNPKTGRVVIVEDCKQNKEWRQSVTFFARKAYQGEPLHGPLSLFVTFFVTRPKNHFGAGRNASVLRSGAPTHPVSKPDATKLLRITEDALTDAGIWRDDAQVVEQIVRKRYASKPGAIISIGRPEPAEEIA